jgi:hypothetical protein
MVGLGIDEKAWETNGRESTGIRRTDCLVVGVVVFDHCTAMVTVFEVAPRMAITAG